MARITHFERSDIDRFRLHEVVDAKLFVHEYDGRKVLQVSTYGRDSRQDVGKMSQTFQIDADAAAELFLILKSEFGLR